MAGSPSSSQSITLTTAGYLLANGRFPTTRVTPPIASAAASISVLPPEPPVPDGLAGACHNAAVGLELVIRGVTVVTPGHRETADIGIADGRIAQLGGTMAGTQELDAGGLLAIPGGVDAHTHLVHQGLGGRLGFPTWVDDFWSGSRAAITGGITTIGNMTSPGAG